MLTLWSICPRFAMTVEGTDATRLGASAAVGVGAVTGLAVPVSIFEHPCVWFGHSVLRSRVGALMPNSPETIAFRRHAAEARKIARTIYDKEERRIVLAFIEASEKMFPEKNHKRKAL